MTRSGFDPSRYKWREVKGEPGASYKIRHDYTILGYDISSTDTLSTELGGGANVERAMRRAQGVQMTHLQKILTFLAIAASVTPFIGLFGTVWGIMNSFLGLSQSGNTTLQAVAPGSSEALVATAMGLEAAIPALVAYNHFSRQAQVIGVEMENFASEFLNIAERHFLG